MQDNQPHDTYLEAMQRRHEKWMEQHHRWRKRALWRLTVLGAVWAMLFIYTMIQVLKCAS